MSYQAAISEPAIRCDAPSCKASSDDYPVSRHVPRRSHKSIRLILMSEGWVCALGIDLCRQHADARYDHKVETILAKEDRRGRAKAIDP